MNCQAVSGVNKVWECSVAGLVPTNATDMFRATLSKGRNNCDLLTAKLQIHGTIGDAHVLEGAVVDPDANPDGAFGRREDGFEVL